MPGKRFWPPTRHKLFYANIVLYLIIILLLVLFNRELMWAQKTMRGYLFTGQLDSPASNLLMLEAMKYPKIGQGAEKHHQLLQKAYHIDPHSMVLLMLGDYYAEQGQDDIAMDYYQRFRSFDPSFAAVYFKMARILERKGDHEALFQLLEEGIDHFEKRTALYHPRYDPSVIKEFNLKAAKTYNMAKQGLEELEKMEKKPKDSEQWKQYQE